MKASELKELQESSADVLATYPPRMTMDGMGRLYNDIGSLVSTFDVLRDMDAAREKMERLNSLVQWIKGRKAPGKG